MNLGWASALNINRMLLVQLLPSVEMSREAQQLAAVHLFFSCRLTFSATSILDESVQVQMLVLRLSHFNRRPASFGGRGQTEEGSTKSVSSQICGSGRKITPCVCVAVTSGQYPERFNITEEAKWDLHVMTEHIKYPVANTIYHSPFFTVITMETGQE